MLSMTVGFGLLSYCPAFGAQVTLSSTDEVETVGYSLENSLVSRYLQHADVAYSDGIGRSGTSILCYWLLGEEVSPYMYEVPESGGLPLWAEQCAPITLPAVEGGSVVVSTTPTFENYLSISVESDSVSIYNLIPQKVYWYRVLNSDKKILSNGIFKTQGYLRMIKTEKVLNVRDIGGWECDGGRLAYGKIFRGATLEGITSKIGPVEQEDINELVTNLGILSEVDLRDEATTTSSPLGSSVDYNNIVIEDYMYLMENIKPGYAVNTGTYYEAFATFIDCIVSNIKAGKGTYVHCKWGADRTGTVIAIIEALCGVSEVDIVQDWELTSFNAASYRKYINVQDYYSYKNSSGQTVTAPTELRAVFEYLYDNYGGASGASIKEQVVAWLQDKVYSNLSDKGASIIEELRALLIEEEKTSPKIIKDLSKEIGEDVYSCTVDSTTYWSSKVNQYVNPTTGVITESDVFSTTGYVLCENYTKLLVNVVGENIAAFYDENLKFIGGIKDSSVTSSFGSETILFENKEYDIPSGAKYVKLNMSKYSGLTVVLSEESLLE